MNQICIILCAKNIIKFRICINFFYNFQTSNSKCVRFCVFFYSKPVIYERFVHVFDLYDIVSLD